ncbi:MAG: Maf family protein [Erysipelothrix sp.]
MLKKLVLASQSPRRRELLTYLGLPFSVVSPTSEEVMDLDLPIDARIEKLAYDKAMSVDLQDNTIVIGADTVVVIDGQVLGKPESEEDAISTLKQLSGRTHQVITGVSMRSVREHVTFSVKTDVKFYELSDEAIEAYVATREPLDKAGSYGIQGKGALLVESIVGDYYTVIGLPISRVNYELEHRNW